MLPFHQLPGSPALTGLVVARGTSAAIALKINLSAIVDPGVNDDSSAGYAVGSQWINTLSSTVFTCTDASVGAAVWTSGSGGSGGSATKETITFANSFGAGDIIRRTASSYVAAQADTAANSEVLGVVESATGSTFTIVYFGKLSITAHGYTVGAVLFLSSSVAGLLTETEPTAAGKVSKPVAVVLDADNLLITNMRGLVLSTSGDGFAKTTLASTNVALVFGTDPLVQSFNGTLSGPVIIDISRTGAIAGKIYQLAFVGVVTTGTNTITIRENSSGSLFTLDQVGTASGKVEVGFNGTAWEIISASITYV